MMRAIASRAARRAFGALIRFYPLDFRRRFGDDMRSLFDDQLLDAERAGRLGAARFLLRTIAATVASIGAPGELTAPARRFVAFVGPRAL